MPDLGVPVGDGPVAHVSTPQWQSFELRMRARKAERCLQRASAAIENGSIDEATAALEEASSDRSAWVLPASRKPTARPEALSQPKPDLDLQLEAFSYSEPESPKRGFVALAVAAVCGLALLSIGGWEALDASSGVDDAVTEPFGSGMQTAGRCRQATSASGPAESQASVPRAEAVVETKVVHPEVVTEKPTALRTPERPRLRQPRSRRPAVTRARQATHRLRSNRRSRRRAQDQEFWKARRRPSAKRTASA